MTPLHSHRIRRYTDAHSLSPEPPLLSGIAYHWQFRKTHPFPGFLLHFLIYVILVYIIYLNRGGSRDFHGGGGAQAFWYKIGLKNIPDPILGGGGVPLLRPPLDPPLLKVGDWSATWQSCRFVGYVFASSQLSSLIITGTCISISCSYLYVLHVYHRIIIVCSLYMCISISWLPFSPPWNMIYTQVYPKYMYMYIGFGLGSYPETRNDKIPCPFSQPVRGTSTCIFIITRRTSCRVK